MKVRNGVIGDEELIIGRRKMCKMGQVVAKTGQVVFSTFAHCHGPPHETFTFFWAWYGGWKVVAAILSKKWGTVSFFLSFLTIFAYFLPVFSFSWFLAHFAHFTPPYGRPLITYDPISYFHVSWVQLAHGRHCRQKKSMNFGFFLKNDHFSIFGHFDPCQPPYKSAN